VRRDIRLKRMSRATMLRACLRSRDLSGPSVRGLPAGSAGTTTTCAAASWPSRPKWNGAAAPATGGLYVIPIGDATRTQGTLRIDPTANGQDKRVRWARDYELPA
jgi:hypothetical protein